MESKRVEKQAQQIKLISLINKANVSGNSLIIEEKYQEALEKFLSVLSLTRSPSFVPFKQAIENFIDIQANACVNVGLCYKQLGNSDRAEASYREALALKQDHPKARCELAEILAQTNPKEAIEQFNKIKKKPEFRLAALNGLVCARINLGAELCNSQKFFEAIVHFEWAINNTTAAIDYKIISLYQMAIVYQTKDFIKQDPREALKYFKQCVESYQLNATSAFSPRIKSAAASAAHNWANLLDSNEEGIVANPEKTFELLHFAASLGRAEAWHDLGWKLEHGEDVNKDIDQAISLYTEARRLKYAPSQVNLGRIFLFDPQKRNVTEALNCFAEAEAQKEASAYYYVAFYYFEDIAIKTFIPQFETGHTLINLNSGTEGKYPTEKSVKNNTLALEKFKQAAALGFGPAMFNAAVFIQNGLGTEPDKEEAENYYRQALAAGVTAAASNLFSILQEKFNKLVEKTALSDSRKNLIQELQALLPELELCFKQARPQEYRAEEFSPTSPVDRVIPAILSKKISPAGVELRGPLFGQYAGKFERMITEILELVPLSTSSADIVDVIHRVGMLTENCLANRNFHQSQYFLQRVALKKSSKALEEDKLSQSDILKIIVGASKFYLTANAPEHAECVILFYKKMLALPQLDLEPQVALLYAMTRLDPALSIFKKQLPELKEKIFSSSIKWSIFPVNERYKRIFSNLIFCLMQFDNAELVSFDKQLDEFKRFVQSLLKQCKQVVNDKQKMSEEKTKQAHIPGDDTIYFQQVYQALTYFGKFYPQLEIDRYLLKSLADNLTQKTVVSTISAFQNILFSFLKKYFPDAKAEKIIHSLPVDGFFQLDERHFLILDIRGPQHYLHGDEKDEPVLNLKTRAHETLVQIPQIHSEEDIQLDFVAVPYFKLPSQPTEEQMHQFLSAELAGFGIKLEGPLEKVKGHKARVDRNYLFSQQRMVAQIGSEMVAPQSNSKKWVNGPVF
ncbi:MAG: hypothetical protein ABI597_07440 [Gammaproteobacteria bacterium]